MAQPTTLRGSKMLIQLGDGNSPEVFTAPCALNTKGLNMSAATNDFAVADCDDPDAPVWQQRAKASWSGSISGSGTLAKESYDLYKAFFDDPDPRNVKIILDYDTDPIELDGQFHMTTFNLSGSIGELVQVEIELLSHGPITEAA